MTQVVEEGCFCPLWAEVEIVSAPLSQLSMLRVFTIVYRVVTILYKETTYIISGHSVQYCVHSVQFCESKGLKL